MSTKLLNLCSGIIYQPQDTHESPGGGGVVFSKDPRTIGVQIGQCVLILLSTVEKADADVSIKHTVLLNDLFEIFAKDFK